MGFFIGALAMIIIFTAGLSFMVAGLWVIIDCVKNIRYGPMELATIPVGLFFFSLGLAGVIGVPYAIFLAATHQLH